MTGTPHGSAAALLTWLEVNGAVVAIDDDDDYSVDLNPLLPALQDRGDADLIVRALQTWREEIRGILIARRTVH